MHMHLCYTCVSTWGPRGCSLAEKEGEVPGESPACSLRATSPRKMEQKSSITAFGSKALRTHTRAS